MKYLCFLMVLFSICSSEKLNLAKWDKKELSQFLSTTFTKSNSTKVKNITDEFLNTAYKANTMIGSSTQKEELVIDLENLDCFTFIDYVEAMKHSQDFDEFKNNLINLRYQFGNLNYTSRNHFFSDWTIYNNFENITLSISSKAKSVRKTLNLSKTNTPFLKGIKTRETTIDYIDSKDLNEEIISSLKTGDYIGIFTHIKGLDVTHTGIIIKKENKTFFRHASSKKKYLKVVDEDFKTYIKNTPGFIVLRQKGI